MELRAKPIRSAWLDDERNDRAQWARSTTRQPNHPSWSDRRFEEPRHWAARTQWRGQVDTHQYPRRLSLPVKRERPRARARLSHQRECAAVACRIPALERAV